MRLSIMVLAGCGAALVAVSSLMKPPLLFVWNASASAPTGLYRVSTDAPARRGEMAVAWAPASVRQLGAERHYIPANVPLVKRIAAIEGDRVCADGVAISVDRRIVAIRRRADGAGRPMPWWSGCRTLGRQEYLLLMDKGSSFDGRYFGISRGSEVIGRARLVRASAARGGSHG